MVMTYPYPQGDGVVKWVSTTWLEEHLNDKNLMILDIQPNVHDYIQGHIPKATYINEGLFRIHRRIPSFWLPPDVIQGILRNIGIRREMPVVIYTSPGPLSICTKFIGDGLEQTMAAYTLARYGHPSVYVLDGGLTKWKEEKKLLSQEFPSIPESDYRVTLKSEYYISYDEVRFMKDRPDVTLLDARPSPVYEGQGPWPKPGHIPGAVSLPWASLMNEKNKMLLKPEEEIRSMVKEKGATPEKTIICSCGTGREATNEFILFKWFLKYPKVKIYEGSFTEWISYKDNPTVLGKNPR